MSASCSASSRLIGLLIVLLSGGCGSGGETELSFSARARALREAPREDPAAQQLPNGKYRFVSRSMPLVESRPYSYRLTSVCDLQLLDFDGSFWDLSGVSVEKTWARVESALDGETEFLGVVTVLSNTRATLELGERNPVVLERHSGPKFGSLCL